MPLEKHMAWNWKASPEQLSFGDRKKVTIQEYRPLSVHKKHASMKLGWQQVSTYPWSHITVHKGSQVIRACTQHLCGQNLRTTWYSSRLHVCFWSKMKSIEQKGKSHILVYLDVTFRFNWMRVAIIHSTLNGFNDITDAVEEDLLKHGVNVV